MNATKVLIPALFRQVPRPVVAENDEVRLLHPEPLPSRGFALDHDTNEGISLMGLNLEMVVIHAGGPRVYSLRVNGNVVGRDDFLGVEDEIERRDPDGILGFMVRFGAERGKATRFRRDFERAEESKRAAGGLLQKSNVFNPEDYP